MDQLLFALVAPLLVCGGFVLWAWGLCIEEIPNADYCRSGVGMRNWKRRWLPVVMMIVGGVLMFAPLLLLSQETNGPLTPALSPDGGEGGPAGLAPMPDLGPLLPLVNGLLGKYGWLSQVLMVLGALRVIMKPAMSLWRTHVESTASTEDDQQLAAIEHSKAYHVVAYLLDWGGSIKIGPRKDLK